MTTHRQHYVPKMYLKNFAIDNMCYVLDEYGNIRKKSIKSICYQKDLYELTSVVGTTVNENCFEDMFGKIETMYEPFMKDLFTVLSSKKSLKKYLDEGDNRHCLIIFLVSMFLRNPTVFEVTPEAARDVGIEWTDVQSRNNAILHNASLLQNISDKLYKTHKVVILENNTDVEFVTSNFPSYLMLDETNKTRGYMMLSPRYCLLLLDKRLKETQADSVVNAPIQLIDYYNSKTVTMRVNKQIIAKKKDTLERYKYIMEGPKK